jgi:hypothetical protein
MISDGEKNFTRLLRNMDIQELKKIIQDNPECLLYYHDNGAWVIYASRKELELAEQGEELSENAILYEGDDHSGLNGYVPPLVEAMCELLDIEVESV